MTTIFEKIVVTSGISRNSILEIRSNNGPAFGPFGISRSSSGPVMVRTVREEYPDVPDVPEVPEVPEVREILDGGWGRWVS